MTERNMEQFKLLLAGLVDVLIRDAVERGEPTKPIYQRLGAECLEYSARIHAEQGGTVGTFICMASDMIVLVRTGAQTQ